MLQHGAGGASVAGDPMEGTASRIAAQRSLLGSLAVRDTQQNHGLPSLQQRGVHDEVALPLELDDVALLQGPHVGVALGSELKLCVWVHQVLQVVVFLWLGFGDELRKLQQLQVHQLAHVRQPCELQLGFLEVSLRVELALQCCNHTIRPLADFPDEAVAPVHEGDLLTLGDGLGVNLLHQHPGHLDGGLLPRRWALLMPRDDHHLGLGRDICELQADTALGGNGSVPWADRVDDALVDGPNLVPLL
mmetsp:Transcript_1284/g.3682  ORF Transcript_1284/g.3682 Transcript_1284/m.3682 type:complete len:247 (+) Transcript_1284:108-848(+)